MTLKSLVEKHHWLSIETTLVHLYADQLNLTDAYRRVFERLLTIEPVEKDLNILVHNVVDDFDGENYVAVSGRTPGKPLSNPENPNENYLYAIEFTPWSEWLGMNIDPESFDEFTELEIIAHCLHEMTFVSFDETKIQSQMDALKKQIDEIDAMTPDERSKHFKPLGDLLNELNADEEE